MNKNKYTSHHVALSVSNLERSIKFYGSFGFKPVLRWTAPDTSLSIVHLKLRGGYFIELFCYSKNAAKKPLKTEVGNDLADLGIKHMALRVEDVYAARKNLKKKGFTHMTEITEGRTGIDYFFCKDPDGIWMEILSDKRKL